MSDTPSPQVTVLMSVYNGKAYLAEAIESILSQTFSGFEFLMVNGASTDGSADILDTYAAKDDRIRVIHEQENSGLIGALNLGLAEARGGLIARMDDDDIAVPDRLQRQIDFLTAHPNVGVVGGFLEDFAATGEVLGVREYPTEPREIKRGLLERGQVAHVTVMMRRDLALKCGGYRPLYKSAEDYDLWLRLSEMTDIANLPAVLVRCRIHGSSVTKTDFLRQHQSVVTARAAARCRRRGAGDPTAGLTDFPEDFLERFCAAGEDYSTLAVESLSVLICRALQRDDLAGALSLVNEARSHRPIGHDQKLIINALLEKASDCSRNGQIARSLSLVSAALRLFPRRTLKVLRKRRATATSGGID